MRIVLDGLAANEPLDDIVRQLRAFAEYAFPFPGSVLIDVAADALTVVGATRSTPVSITGATERHLVEWSVTGNTARQKHRAALQAAVATHGGIAVDYDEVAGWWQHQDFTLHAFEAAVVLIRLAAEHTGRSLLSVCDEIAANEKVPLDRSTTDDRLLP